MDVSNRSVHIGIDLADVARIKKILIHYDTTTLGYLFSLKEQQNSLVSKDNRYLAVCFSGKESVGKALGTGLAGLNWHEIQIFPQADFRLEVMLEGEAKRRALAKSIKIWHGYWHFLSENICLTTLVTE